MKKILINENECISLGSCECEEDLDFGDDFDDTDIDPIPPDNWCDCCGRRMSQLKPFGKAGDPLVGDFEGALLVKRWRRDGPYDEEAEEAMREAQKCYQNDGYKEELDWMVDKYGEEKGKKLYWTAMCYGSTGSSWECRDCIVLDQNSYFEKLHQRLAEQPPALPGTRDGNSINN